jgi:hypothetical protein
LENKFLAGQFETKPHFEILAVAFGLIATPVSGPAPIPQGHLSLLTLMLSRSQALYEHKGVGSLY